MASVASGIVAEAASVTGATELLKAKGVEFWKNIFDCSSNVKALYNNSMVLKFKWWDLENQIQFLVDSGQMKRKQEIEHWCERAKDVGNEVSELIKRFETNGFTSRVFDGSTITKQNEEVLRLIEQTHFFNDPLAENCETRGVPFFDIKMFGKGFEENFNSIWRLLEGGEVSRIGIWGMAAVGKTALAKCINNQILEQSQMRVFWITVSHEFTVGSLQEKMARLIGVNLLDGDGTDTKAVSLHNILSKMKNPVLILDDVWEFIDLLKVGCQCCRLIVTSRSLEVCRQILCQEVITVEKLSEDEASKLFSETLTAGEEIEQLSPQVEEIKQRLVRLCDGLPLGIITLARSMRGITSLHSWRATLADLEYVASQDVMEEVFETIRSSFTLLNRKDGTKSNKFNLIQLCFLCCLLSYTQGAILDRNDLVERFMSQGLLDGRTGRNNQVDQGHLILDKLVSICLLEESVSPPGLKIHQLVRGMAMYMLGGNIR